MLIVICYAAVYMAVVKNIKKRGELKNQLTDRYLMYMKENCSLSRKVDKVQVDLSSTQEKTQEGEL